MPAPLDVLDPATGDVIASLPMADAGEIDAAVTAARHAQPAWERTPPAERAAAVKAGAAAIKRRLGEIAELQTRENGKPLADSRGGVEACAGTRAQYGAPRPLHRRRALQGS